MSTEIDKYIVKPYINEIADYCKNNRINLYKISYDLKYFRRVHKNSSSSERWHGIIRVNSTRAFKIEKLPVMFNTILKGSSLSPQKKRE